jgi:type VI secretion system protein ImpC
MTTLTQNEKEAATTEVVRSGKELLEWIIAESGLASCGPGGPGHPWNSEEGALAQLIGQIADGTVEPSADTVAMVNAAIGRIDHITSEQLTEFLHNLEFQRLESAWRGLQYLVLNSETSDRLKIRVLNISRDELQKDLERAVEFDQSTLFKKLYEEEFGILGGEPFGLIIGDFEFCNSPRDVRALAKLSGIAAAAHAPFVGAAAPSMFGWESHTEIGDPRDLTMIFDGAAYDQWKDFRKTEDSRYVGLTLPRILLRLPYGKDTVQAEGFAFEEGVDGKDHGDYLWGNAAYALGVCIAKAFAEYGWCANIRGIEGGGLVEDLPLHVVRADEGDLEVKCPTEVAITERRLKELSDLGFIPLCHHRHTGNAVFFTTKSAQKPAKYDQPDATANAELSTQLQYILAVSRFAHYLKAIMRQKLGANMSREECETFLNTWIQQYVLDRDSAEDELKRKYPLREAKVTVEEDLDRPGYYRATARLRPHYQLDGITVSLRLVARMPAQPGA